MGEYEREKKSSWPIFPARSRATLSSCLRDFTPTRCWWFIKYSSGLAELPKRLVLEHRSITWTWSMWGTSDLPTMHVFPRALCYSLLSPGDLSACQKLPFSMYFPTVWKLFLAAITVVLHLPYISVPHHENSFSGDIKSINMLFYNGNM